MGSSGKEIKLEVCSHTMLQTVLFGTLEYASAKQHLPRQKTTKTKWNIYLLLTSAWSVVKEPL